eukprot:7602301-Ditylum_brightwellii.AAC.1
MMCPFNTSYSQEQSSTGNPHQGAQEHTSCIEAASSRMMKKWNQQRHQLQRKKAKIHRIMDERLKMHQ